jgi:APA family basic amino acid/polyamine antiporter
VAAGVLVLRRTQPERRRGFRVPWVPVLPVAAILCCLVLMVSLPVETWLRFVVWLAIGLAIYFGYSRKRSALRDGAAQESA